jgi:hypothetical protein
MPEFVTSLAAISGKILRLCHNCWHKPIPNQTGPTRTTDRGLKSERPIGPPGGMDTFFLDRNHGASFQKLTLMAS